MVYPMPMLKEIFPLFSSALTLLPLLFAPYSLALLVKQLVITAWIGMPLSRLFQTKGRIFSWIILAVVAAWGGYAQTNSYNAYWLYLCAASLACSTFLFSLRETNPPQPAPELPVFVPEPPDNTELTELKKQIQQLVPWQYRALEAEQALEQERGQLALSAAKNEELGDKISILQKTLEEYEVQNQKENQSECSIETLKALEAKFEKLQLEHADLTTCYQHLNNELQEAEKHKDIVKESEEYHPQDLLKAWQESDREQRRYKGLYHQLQEQFEEQADTLKKNRKQLFETEEILNAERIAFFEMDLENGYAYIKALGELSETLEHAMNENQLLVSMSASHQGESIVKQKN